MKIDFDKYADGLVPAIVQDAETEKVLMLGFMNSDAFTITQETGRATFYSRSRRKIWTKGETSGNFLYVKQILVDCDADAILLKVEPSGSVCHTGSDTCFDEKNEFRDFLFELEKIVKDRKENPKENSYTSKLFSGGIDKIAQKLGEEAVELIIEAKNDKKENFKAEAADLLYHFIVLLSAKNVALAEVLEKLKERRK
jgi:phosphoribosyl-AMP cyclohydrolase / phosphoribosyl-ATP pyrophosphohydrolase